MKKQVIRLTESDLQNMVRNVITYINEERCTEILKQGEFSNHGKQINVGIMKELNSKELFDSYAEKIWEMLQISYEPLGGIKSYHSYKDFVKKGHLANVILDSDGTMLACETYRKIEGSNKIVACGCDQTPKGKLALQQLVQSNIVNLDLHFWSEVSGAMEHYFKKYNGYPMLNTMASEILNLPQSEITLMDDNVHYERAIGEDREIYCKMIFGIKSEDVFKQVVNAVENYGNFMKEINNIDKDNINESVYHYSLKQAIYIIENIYRAREEDGFNELIPSWYEALKECLVTLNNQQCKTDIVETYINYANYLLSEMPLLTLLKL